MNRWPWGTRVRGLVPVVLVAGLVGVGVYAAPGVAAAGPPGPRESESVAAGTPTHGVRPSADRGRPDRPRGTASPPARGPASPVWDGRHGSALPSPSIHHTASPSHRPPAHGPRAEESAEPTEAAEPAEPAESAPEAESTRAGSRAGEGQERPGRREAPDEDPGADEELAEEDQGSDTGPVPPTAPQSPAARPLSAATPQAAVPTEPVLEILPLGSGLVLIGLGLGLAFIALRLRRD
ncbi:hypothetical protein [Streptomyces sp. NPDC058739]|uniref:hypothetical protein n=1 Tax=Streptomyces sp. NPDC058739 TaxID=3346618 RepID=UPI0036C858B2